MSASNYLNADLFHGTHHDFAEDEFVDPTKDPRGTGLAWATTDRDVARHYAKQSARMAEKTTAYVWNVTAKDWLQDVARHPRGTVPLDQQHLFASEVGFNPEYIAETIHVPLSDRATKEK